MIGPTARLLLGLGGRHKGPLALTYGLTALAETAELLYPLLIGRAIDGLLNGRRGHLIELGVVLALHLVIGMVQNMYNTRVFTRIYRELAGEIVVRQRAAGENLARVAARVGLTREIIAFYEVEIPATAASAIRLGGTVIMLFLLHRGVGSLALAALLPILAANWWFARRSYRLHGALNDVLEREVAIVNGAAAPAVDRHFSRLAFWRIRVSDAEARTWGLLDLVNIALVLGALTIVTGQAGATVGSTFAVLGYVLSYVGIVEDLPNIVQNVARVYDIAARVVERENPTA